MKIKTLLFTMLCLSFAFVANAEDSIPIKLNTSSLSKMTCTYDNSTGVYTCKSTDVSPLIYTEALSSNLSSDYYILSFEYQTTLASQYFQIFFGNTFNATRQKLFGGLSVASEWTTYTVNIKAGRDDFSWGNAGETLMFHFAGMPANSDFKLRNIRIINPIVPFKDVTIKPKTATTVQAEDYNQGGIYGGYSARQYPNLDLPTYQNPAGNKFPILAWGSLPETLCSTERFQELADCGFNLSLQKFSTTGNITSALQNCTGTGVQLIVNFWGLSQISDAVNWYKTTDNFAGWFIGDEPFSSKFAEYGDLVKRIRATGSTRMNYCNLYHSGTDVGALGTNSYTDYLQRFVREVKTGFLSYDLYPIVTDTVLKKNVLRSYFYQNLELASMVSKQYNIPFWAFARSTASEEDVYYHVFFPTPTKAYLRFQVFTDLAYGAQGIQYYSYAPQSGGTWVYHDAPLDDSYNKTAVWYMVKDVNEEIQNHAWVFLGAKMIDVSHTGTVPDGTRVFNASTLPSHFSAIKSSGNGVMVSQLKNGNNRFLMIMGRDLDVDQTVYITKTDTVNLVKTDGTTVVDANKIDTITVSTGDYILYQWIDSTSTDDEVYVPAATANLGTASDYRSDSMGVPLLAGSQYANSWAISNMGDENWKVYSLGEYKKTSNRQITKAQAIENWGSWYRYTVDVDEDMDANIYIKHNVDWTKYGPEAATGVEPGLQYVLFGLSKGNWPKRYAASMILSLDGTNLKTNQTARPVAPSTYDAAGTEFSNILSDKTKWTSTLVKTAANDTLWFWPKNVAGDGTPYYNDTPDYANVHLTKGAHKLIVTSLCSPWDFDCIKVVDVNSETGIENVAVKPSLNAYGTEGAIVVQGDGPVKVYSSDGVLVGNAKGTIRVPAGIYIIKSAEQTKKVVVK